MDKFTKRFVIAGSSVAILSGVSILSLIIAFIVIPFTRRLTEEAPLNAAVVRMSYGRFLDSMEEGRITAVDFYNGGRNAVVETVDPEIENRVQRVRVDLPGFDLVPELINTLKEEGISFEIHPPRSALPAMGLLENLLLPLLTEESPHSNIERCQHNPKCRIIRYSDFHEYVQEGQISRVLISCKREAAMAVENDGRRAMVHLMADKHLLSHLTDNQVDIAFEPCR